MKRILVCEDEDVIRDFVVINLKRAGYDVTDVNCGEEALKTIKDEHVPRLIRIFQQWKAGADFKALRITAMKECPGLTQIWEEPFQALYTVADGEIVIRFRENNDAVEVAADHLTKAK